PVQRAASGICTIRALPRSTRICAIVFGSVTTSSFFRRYVVSIPAKGGTSSRTWTRTWSLSVGATGARLVSSARTTFIPAGFSFAGTTVDVAGGGAGSTPNAEPPKASVRGFLKSADVRGQPIVEIRLEAHEGLLAALLAVDLRDALKIDLLLTRHVVHIRRPIFDGFRLATLIARGLIGWTSERSHRFNGS